MSMFLALMLVLGGQDNGTGGPGDRWQSIDATAGFRDWRRDVRRHVDRYATYRVNHLCGIVGINVSAGQPDDAIAYLYWPEQRRIERLSANDDSSMPPDVREMLFQLGPISLDRDIIDSAEEVNLNPNAVTRGWVKNLIARCRRSGTRITIIKRR